MIVALTLALAAPLAPKSVTQAAVNGQLRQIDRSRHACKVRSKYPSPAELQSCDADAIHSYGSLLAKSKSSPAFETLLSDTFEPLLLRMTGGDDALAIRVVVLSNQADFARTRVQILTGRTHLNAPGRRATNAATFSWIASKQQRRKFALRWTLIRQQDCQVYRVRQCDEQLDRALTQLLKESPPAQY
jgi:hypothetical protein